MESFFSQEIYELYENTNIPLAVFYVENGRFRTYIVSRGSCDMYESTREEMLERLNGDDPFVNIVEKDEMLKAVKAFSDNDEPYNVVFHERIGKDKKLKTIHGIGNHEYTADGRRYSVIRYDEISDSSRRMLFREEEKKIAEHQKLLAGLSCEYESVWLADAENHHAKLIRSNMGTTESSMVMNRISEGRYETIIDNYIERYVVPEDRERVRQMSSIENLMINTKEDEIYYINYCRINPEGSKNYLQLSVARVTDDMGEVRFVCGFRNIDAIIEEEKLKDMLYRMAHVDSMTDVNNRRSFDEFMDGSDDLDISEETVFFSFDLNDLKKANDTCGHEAGDELIIGAADCMKEVLGQYGSIYRTGGDEFVVIAEIPVKDRDMAIKRLMNRFDSWKGNLYTSLSISTGYVCASEDPSMTFDEMRQRAEKRMYDQKAAYHMQEGNDRRKSRC